MSDILNPLSPRSPQQFVLSDQGKPSDQPSETVYIEGAEDIPLVSKGVFYTWDQKFWKLEKIKVRQLNYTDEDILTTASYFENGTIFQEVLRNVIVDANHFPASKLSPIDRDTILIWLRSKAFGNEFEITTNCPNENCSTSIRTTWDLSALDIPTYEEGVLEQLQQYGELPIETPLQKVKVRIIVPSAGDALDAEKRMTQKKKNNKETKDSFGTGLLMLIISGVEVDGKIIRNKSEIQNYFNKINLSISDSRYIRKKATEITLKYQTAKTIVCPNCGHIQEDVEMPILHPNFFWNPEGQL